MQHRRTILGIVFALALLVPTFAHAAPQGSIAIPVTQALPASGAFPGGTLTGLLTITSFQASNGNLNAVGTLTGTIVDSAGQLVGNIVSAVTVPVTNSGGSSCSILHLELGPLDLNLLGLVVHLDRIVLDISAQPGTGNLLGNLLCSVANLLNGSGPLAQLVNQLNQLLAAL